MRSKMTRFTLTAPALAAMLSMSAIPTIAATFRMQESAKADEKEKKVKMQDLPAAVQNTVREQSKGATIRGLSQETEKGITSYEVELKINGHNKDIEMDANGVVLEIEEQVTLASLPAAVRTAIQKNAGAGRIGMVESITKGGNIVAYEAHVKTAGKAREVKVGPDGQLITGKD